MSLSVATATETGASGGGNGREWRRKWAPVAAEMGASGGGNGRQWLHRLTNGGCCSDRLSERRQPQQNCFSESQPGARAHPSERVNNQREPQTASARIMRQRLRRPRARGSVHGLSASLDSFSSLSSSAAGGPESEPR